MSTIPPGLLAVHDLLERHPEERATFLPYEIRKREREHALFVAGKKLLQVNIWAALRAMLVVGTAVFTLVWTLGLLAQVNAWVEHAWSQSVTVPVPLGDDLRLDLGRLFPRPTSSLWLLAARLPLWNFSDAGTIALIAMVVVALEKGVVAWMTWTHARELKGAALELAEEIKTLKEWRDQEAPPVATPRRRG